jgi:hypothetical protein
VRISEKVVGREIINPGTAGKEEKKDNQKRDNRQTRRELLGKWYFHRSFGISSFGIPFRLTYTIHCQ